jgi:hypothetical protein
MTEAGLSFILTRCSHNQKLQDPQNLAVQDYLTMLHYAGTSANLEALVLAANRVLFYSGSTGTVSQKWAKRWMIRHTEFFKTPKTKPMHVKRLAVHVVEDVNDYFVDFHWCKDKWGIHDDDVSNFDKSGFPIGVTTSEHVIVEG